MNPSEKPKFPANRLIDSSSPYLQQHAYNPVDWYPWGEEALEKAKKEDKPIIVSIGYSACHWCHVMERESFENKDIADIMNAHYVSIKVDREERPDVDAIYMDAVHAMGNQGGWPLNAFLTPDAKPFFAGTYFPAQNWAQLLLRIQKVYTENREDLEKSADDFKKVLTVSDSEKYGLTGKDQSLSEEELNQMFHSIAPHFDPKLGGMQKAPKFPMPSIYSFLLRFALATQNEELRTQASHHVLRTLDAMARGGIYDQIGGGFARYSVDAQWFAPHFEKMLYDNGQLLSLYSDAYRIHPSPLYKKVVYQTIEFAQRELSSPEGAFYSALDADSEGIEGKFYIWTWEEILEYFPEEQERKQFAEFYQVTEEGNWEHNYNILYRTPQEAAFREKWQLSEAQLAERIQDWSERLFTVRSGRIRPGLDDKVLCAWNALMLLGLVDAYRTFGEPFFLERALSNAKFLKECMITEDMIYRNYKEGKASIRAYLEDYSLCIQAFTQLYQVTFDTEHLALAQKLTELTLEHFWDAGEELFYFTDRRGEKLIARKKEIMDNVIPASNSIMANNLYTLGLLLSKDSYLELAQKMRQRVQPMMQKNIEYLSNWGILYSNELYPTAEVVILGEKAHAYRAQMDTFFYPNKVLLGSQVASDALPLLENRSAPEGKTLIYVCFNKTCQLPVESPEAAWQEILKSRK